jgi:Ser-tRNA(Ala) deacylase AlaX
MMIGTFMLFFFVLAMMVIIGAVPVMIVSLGNKSKNDRTRLDSSEKILQLEQRIEELENQLNGNLTRRIENIETIVTEDEYGNKKLENKDNTKKIEAPEKEKIEENIPASENPNNNNTSHNS